MNKFLADALSLLNSILAVLITLGGGVISFVIADANEVLLGIFGLAGGFLAAVLICGLLAVLIQIKDELVLLNQKK